MIGSSTGPATRRAATIRRLLLGLLIVVLAMLSACARHSDETWGRVRETGVLRVGMDASFPPFESIAADGALIGLDVDLARELGRRLGVEVQFVANLPYDGLYDALAVGRVDAVISALVVNPARMADFAYSTPYFDAGQVLVVRDCREQRGGATKAGTADAADTDPDARTDAADRRRSGTDARSTSATSAMSAASIADLAGHTLAVELGARGDQEARKWARRLRALTVTPYQTAAEALTAVARGAADGALVDHVSALAAVQAHTDVGECVTGPEDTGLRILGEPIVEEPYAVAVQRESERLLQAIDKAVAEMEADGTMNELVARWLQN